MVEYISVSCERQMFCEIVLLRNKQGAQPAYYPMGNVTFLPGVKGPERETYSLRSTVVLMMHTNFFMDWALKNNS
jgi:hypothetical protein